MESKQRILVFVLIALLVATATHIVSAFGQDQVPDDVFSNESYYHYFYDERCPVCQEQERFHQEVLRGEFPDIEINSYDIRESGSDERLEQLSEKYGFEVERQVVPMTVVGGNLYTGFSEQDGQEILENVRAIERGEEFEREQDRFVTELPFFGRVDIRSVNLPVLGETDLTDSVMVPFLGVLLGTLDGFNVCSIGALLLILGIVLKLGSRKKILAYGGAFIFTTVAVYGVLFFTFYGAVSQLFGYFGVIESLIAFAAFFAGLMAFSDFLKFYKHGPTCETTSSKFISDIRVKVTKVLKNPKAGLTSTLGAIMLFAAAMVVVELPCSAGFPATYSMVLGSLQIPFYLSAIYIIIYLFFYMLIELIIFTGAVISKEIWFSQDKAVTWLTLIAALILLGLGTYYSNILSLII